MSDFSLNFNLFGTIGCEGSMKANLLKKILITPARESRSRLTQSLHNHDLTLSDDQIKNGEWAQVEMLDFDKESSLKFCKAAETTVVGLTTKIKEDFLTQSPGTLNLNDYLSILKSARNEIQKNFDSDQPQRFGEELIDTKSIGYNTHVAKYGNKTYRPIIQSITTKFNERLLTEHDKALFYSNSYINPTYEIDISREEVKLIYSGSIPDELEIADLTDDKVRIKLPLSTLKRNLFSTMFSFGSEDASIKGLMWDHPSYIFIPLIKHEVSKLFNSIHKEVVESSKARRELNKDFVLESVGMIHWLMSQFPFYLRGTAAIAHQFTQSILRACGFRPARVAKDTSPDVTALLTYSPREYVKPYKLGHTGPIGLFERI